MDLLEQYATLQAASRENEAKIHEQLEALKPQIVDKARALLKSLGIENEGVGTAVMTYPNSVYIHFGTSPNFAEPINRMRGGAYEPNRMDFFERGSVEVLSKEIAEGVTLSASLLDGVKDMVITVRMETSSV